MEEQELVEKCLQGHQPSQRAFYEAFAGKMMAVCLRYTQRKQDAHDLFQDAFIRVFEKLDQYNHNGSLEGWVRRIFVTTAINRYHQNKKREQQPELSEVPEPEVKEETVIERMSAQELMDLVNELPEGYRLVFNMYAIEGYSHREIAQALKISEGTSKSQLAKARTYLKNELKKRNQKDYVGERA